MEIRENVPLAPFTTFQIGGPARFLCEARNEEEIREAISWARQRHLRIYVLAGGSNVLVPDEGFGGLVIHIAEGTHALTGNTLAGDAGCNLLSLIREAGGRGLGGWEKLAGIPGTIGGALRGNAGAFGPEMKDFAVSARALHAETLESRVFKNEEMDFSYRHSFFKDHPEWIVTRVTVQLSDVSPEESARLTNETIAEREKRHLQNVRAAGSYFMNPVAPPEIVARFEAEKKVESRESRVPAGWLIEQAGLKGAREGGAEASHQHPNYIVNTGGATAADVLRLAERIKRAVLEQFGVQLKEEAALLQ